VLVVLALFFTVVLSAVCAGLSTFYLNASKETLTFWRQKAEQLFVETEMLERLLSNYFDRGYSLMDSNIVALDEKELDKAGGHVATMKMLIGLYFSDLNPTLSRVIAAIATAHRGLRAVRKAGSSDRAALIEAVDAAVCDLKDALDCLKDSVAKDARVLNRGGMANLFWRPSRTAVVGRVAQVPA
jgi:hypothetical protein